MGALVAAYVAVWLGVTLYVAWLGVRQSHLGRRLEMLETRFKQPAENNTPGGRADD